MIWSLTLNLINLASIYLIGQKRKAGWIVGIGLNIMWAIYFITTEQHAFLIGPAIFGTFSARNWYLWHTNETTESPAHQSN